MGYNKNLFDFVTVKNVVHAHLLAADKLDAPALSLDSFAIRIIPVDCTIKRRRLPTSKSPEVQNLSENEAEEETPLPAGRTRWNQFYESSPVEGESLKVAGQSFFISNGEPVPFWSFARAVYYAYSGHPTPFVFKLPASMGMLVAGLCELGGRLVGKRPDDCAINRKYMQYVLNDMYFDIERVGHLSRTILYSLMELPLTSSFPEQARRLLGYEPVESLEEGIRSAVDVSLFLVSFDLEFAGTDTARSTPTVVQKGRREGTSKIGSNIKESEMKLTFLALA
jgi:sterol-4alpha-carboxylate 3-dehydrogenase (decarboxylating)